MLTPLGDRAVRFAIPPGRDPRSLLSILKGMNGIVDVVLGEEHGAIVFAPGSDRAPAMGAIAEPVTRGMVPAPRQHVVRVVYDGIDLEELATATGLSKDAVIDAHVGRELVVAMCGFMPGFAYLRGMDPRLFVPRRQSPRTKVPAGGVAIAAGYTGIYPFSSPGGWHLVGRASGFAPLGPQGAVLELGDRVVFERTETWVEPAPAPSPPVPKVDGRAHLEVTRVKGVAIVVDGGRRGYMHQGIPHSGPLVRTALARANASLGNSRDTCAVEVTGAIEVTARGGFVALADDENGERVLGPDATHILASRGARARYLAVPGGFDVPPVLGSRTTLLIAKLGGYAGRALKRGDTLLPAREDIREPSDLAVVDLASPIAIVPGPDATDAILEGIVSGGFTVSQVSDRTGVRLEGPKLDARGHGPPSGKSGPMVEGVMQLTSSGLIVLGPDHPTTGGYPIVAVLSENTRDSFFARPPGSAVRFGVADARLV